MAKSAVTIGALLSWLVIAGVTPVFAQFLPLPPPPPLLSKLDPLAQQRVYLTTGHSRVIVRAINAGSVGAVALLLQQLGGTLGRQLPILEAQVADVPNVSLAALSNLTLIRRIALDRLMLGANDRTAATVGATVARQASRDTLVLNSASA